MAPRRKKMRSMMDETALHPYAMADSVVDSIANCFGEKYGTRADAEKLALRAEDLYAKSESFRKKMKRKDPRGLLAAFMQHWHAANLKTRSPKVAKQVGDAAWHGYDLVCPRRKK